MVAELCPWWSESCPANPDCLKHLQQKHGRTSPVKNKTKRQPLKPISKEKISPSADQVLYSICNLLRGYLARFQILNVHLKCFVNFFLVCFTTKKRSYSVLRTNVHFLQILNEMALIYSQRSPTAEPLMCPSRRPVQTGLTIRTASSELPELCDRNTDELPKYTCVGSVQILFRTTVSQ